MTVSVPDDVYRAAADRAAERGTSVSALVTELLIGLSRNEETLPLIEERQHRIASEIGPFRASDRVGRDDLHRRGLR